MSLPSRRLDRTAAFVGDARALCTHVAALRALLELQRDCLTRLEDRLYPATPGGAAARRLMAVRAAEAGDGPGGRRAAETRRAPAAGEHPGDRRREPGCGTRRDGAGRGP